MHFQHQCGADNEALVFDDVTQPHNYVSTRDLDLSSSETQPTFVEDFEDGFSQRQEYNNLVLDVALQVCTCSFNAVIGQAAVVTV